METTMNPNSQTTSQKTNILWSVILMVLSLGLWRIYLVFRWTKNLNYLTRSERYNPWVMAVIYGIGYLLECMSLFTSGSWFLDLLSLLLITGVDLFIIIQIKTICDRQNPGNGTWKNVFGWMIATWIIDNVHSLFTIGHHDCNCFLCSGIVWWIVFAVAVGFYGMFVWLFNQALEHEKNISNVSVNEGTSNGAWIFGIASVLIVVILLFAGATGDVFGGGQTVAEFREAAEKEFNAALASPDHDLRRRVENAHKTVNVHSAYVSDLRITTKDGSNNAGVEGNNIRRINLEITTRWDGIFHKNGYTVIGIEIENISGEWKVTSAGITRTDAMINTEDPNFWYEVGAAAALLLL